VVVRLNGRKIVARSMSDKKTLDQKLQAVTEIADAVAGPLGLHVVECKFGQQGRRRSLEVTIFKKESWVSLSDCEQLSRLLETELDKRMATEGPLIEGSFDLQVQSPGIDRQLKTEREYKIFTGQMVQVQSKEKVGELGINFKGTLVGTADGKLHLSKATAIKPKPHAKGKHVATRTDAPPQDVAIDMKSCSTVKLFSDDLARQNSGEKLPEINGDVSGGEPA
jgi:ribosome maturation factor RimP